MDSDVQFDEGIITRTSEGWGKLFSRMEWLFGKFLLLTWNTSKVTSCK
jgi:hypothetical protein